MTSDVLNSSDSSNSDAVTDETALPTINFLDKMSHGSIVLAYLDPMFYEEFEEEDHPLRSDEPVDFRVTDVLSPFAALEKGDEFILIDRDEDLSGLFIVIEKDESQADANEFVISAVRPVPPPLVLAEPWAEEAEAEVKATLGEEEFA